MPIYTYTCTKCGQKEEYITFKIEDRTYKCQNCGGILKKDITAPAISRLGNSLYDNSRDIERGMAGKPYKGRYYEDETA
jgi:putative FmdB family regulatory protein